MKTLEQVKNEYEFKSFDSRDKGRLCYFIEEKDLPDFKIELKDEYVGNHEAIPFTRENILLQLEKDLSFAFDKALNCRGLSASCMFGVIQMWNWILDEGLADFDEENYAQYGLPLFKATAVKYGFPNPIGDDDGSEEHYTEDY